MSDAGDANPVAQERRGLRLIAGLRTRLPRRVERVQVDLGCGNAKREGYIGLDQVPGPGVDHVLDLTADTYPFADASVDAVYSAHFLEHIPEPNHVFREIGRICREGAKVEFWTPYAFSDDAFLYGHLHFITEAEWMHFCVSHRDMYIPMLGGRWLLHRFVFVIEPSTLADLEAHGMDVAFAVRYLKNVVLEIGVEMEFTRDLARPAVIPKRSYATSRFGERRDLRA
jgi:SAM-dependent methyltransferase